MQQSKCPQTRIVSELSLLSSPICTVRSRYLFARLWMKRVGDASTQTCQCRFERVAREPVRVVVRTQTAAQPHGRCTVNRGRQDAKRRVSLGVRRKQPLIDDALN